MTTKVMLLSSDILEGEMIFTRIANVVYEATE